MCKYCIKDKKQREEEEEKSKLNAALWEEPTGRSGTRATDNVTMNVVRNIFLYFEIIRKNVGQKYKVGRRKKLEKKLSEHYKGNVFINL